MEKESLKRYIIFLAALILCAGVAWYFSKDTEDPQDNAVLAGSRNLIIDLGTAGKGWQEETESETEKKIWMGMETEINMQKLEEDLESDETGKESENGGYTAFKAR